VSAGSTIEWLAWPGYRPATWNPVGGCSRISEGCRGCYAEGMAARFSKPGQWGHGFAEMRGGKPRWTGRVELLPDKLQVPLRWRSPRCIFVNSTSDLFHEKLPDEAIDRVFGVMALCPQHRFICLTKRAERMREYSNRVARGNETQEPILPHVPERCMWNQTLKSGGHWPLPNVIFGVSVEDQETADERIPHLLATPAACRMVSYEPALGPVDFLRWLPLCRVTTCRPDREETAELRLSKKNGPHINWIVMGSESGHGARPCDIDWVRSIRNQCCAAGVAFFWKQHIDGGRKISTPELDGRTWTEFPQITG